MARAPTPAREFWSTPTTVNMGNRLTDTTTWARSLPGREKETESGQKNQFTEVTGPGGIYGNSKETDPIWAMGWDARSVILMLFDEGKWHSYCLPKGVTVTMEPMVGTPSGLVSARSDRATARLHGTFWRFPKSFSKKFSRLLPARTLVIGDFAWWKELIVFGCDDSAQEFLNHRPSSRPSGPLQSNSNLWFVTLANSTNWAPRSVAWLQDDPAKDK